MFLSLPGLIVGAIIRYAGTTTPVIHLNVQADNETKFNQSLPPDTLWLQVSYYIVLSVGFTNCNTNTLKVSR